MGLEDDMFKATMAWVSANKKQHALWESYHAQVAAMTEKVREEFMKVADSIDLKGAKIIGLGVNYSPVTMSFGIKIERVTTPEGAIDENNPGKWPDRCPHQYLFPITGYLGEERLHPRMPAFIRNWNISSIENPRNYCEHK